MAEVVVDTVLNKLADVIVKEAKLLGGVGTKVKQLQRELTRIKLCLQDADYSNCRGNERQQNWLNELRDVADRIEDATDTFIFQVEDIRKKYPRFLQKLMKQINIPLEMQILYKFGTKFDKIQNLLHDISQSRENYGIGDLPLEIYEAVHSEVDETEVRERGRATVEGVMQIVQNKLADVVVKEAQLLGGVGMKVEQMQREVNRIKCCLLDADYSKRQGDVQVQNWLNDLHNVADPIEEATDTFILRVEDIRKKYPRFLQKLMKKINMPLEIPIIYKFGTELDNIQILLHDIFLRRAIYGIELPLEYKSKEEAVHSEVDITEVGGMETDKKKLINNDERGRATVEGVMQIVLKKLADVIVKEAQLLGGAGMKVEQMQREVIRIKCCLLDADHSKRRGDERIQNWLNELRNVADRIEDATDTFFLRVEDIRKKYPRFLRKLMKQINIPLEMQILYKFGTEFDKIQNLLHDISQSRENYGIGDLPLEIYEVVHSEVDETEVRGMETDKKQLINNDERGRATVEGVMQTVLKKLADVIVKEAQLLGGVGMKVEQMQREVIRIKCCLLDADHSKRRGDERIQNWLNELRNVADRIEDATDTFFLRVEDIRKKYPRFFQKFMKKINMPLEIPIIYKFGTELDNIQILLHDIFKSRVNYGIKHLPLEDKSKEEAVVMTFRIAAHSEVDETEVVGMQIDKSKILELLSPQKTSRRSVITIVGAGGLGKTTLAHMVYRSAREDFDYDIMVSISQQFNLVDLLRKMINKYNDSAPKNQGVEYSVGELISFLSSRRYLIVLDDVWNNDLWNKLKDVLPDVENGSRVLMTSRCIEVAKFADFQIPPYKLKFLDDRESLDLLLKKALPYQEPDKEYPTDFIELAGKLSKKCNGLPLALVVLGGILSKRPSYPKWEWTLQNMNWYSDGKDCMHILAMSYGNLPYYVKACFQYLGSFPEDYVISAKSLIRMWTVEGFIPHEGGPTTIEIMAEACLEELSDRSMIQVLSRHANGSMKHFRVHNIFRELAINEAKHENFVTIFSQASDNEMPNRAIRRASLQAQEKNSQFMEYAGPTTRSLLLFVSEYCRTSLDCFNFKLLKVLKIEGIRDGSDLKSLGELINLKYLGLTKCNNIDLSSCSFHRMKSFETLDVRQTTGKPPYDDFWRIVTLMHVRDDEYGSFFDRPISIVDLTKLQTLKWVTLQRGCDVKLPKLHSLGIRNETNEWVSITNLLQTLPLLISLGIRAFGYALPMEIIYPKALPNYQNLQSLYLDGEWPKNVNVEASLLPPNLVKLTLEWSLLNHNPMPELGKLNSLKTLRLRDVFPVDWESPIICREGFPVLQYLTVSDTYIKELRLEQGVMPNLTYLQIEKITIVHLPPQLQHVTVEIF